MLPPKCPSFFFVFLAGFFFSGFDLPAGQKLERAEIEVAGAARQVSGSSFIVRADEATVLVDLGLFYPEDRTLGYAEDRRRTDRRNTSLPIPAEDIDAVVLTHAHLDHVGRVPLLISRGYEGPLYATELTRDLSLLLFGSALRYSSLGAERFYHSSASEVAHTQSGCCAGSRIKESDTFTGERSRLEERGMRLCQICISLEVDRIEERFITKDFGQTFHPIPGVRAEFASTRHIPGSAAVKMTFSLLEGGKKTALISGELGSGAGGFFPGAPEPPGPVDYLFIESTYGEDAFETNEVPFASFTADLAGALADGRRVWIPAFTLDRTQKVLHAIRSGQKAGDLPEEIDVKVLSPSARRFNALYDRHFDYRPETVDETMGFSPVSDLEELDRPVVLITPAYLDGMTFFHPAIAGFLEDRETLVQVVGYADPRSILGRLLRHEGDGAFLVGEQEVTVAAEVRRYHAFSGHTDGPGLVAYAQKAEVRGEVFLVHGEFGGMQRLAKKMEDRLSAPVSLPEAGEVLRIEP